MGYPEATKTNILNFNSSLRKRIQRRNGKHLGIHLASASVVQLHFEKLDVPLTQPNFL